MLSVYYKLKSTVESRDELYFFNKVTIDYVYFM